MHRIATYLGDDAQRIARERPPFGPGWPPEAAARVDRVEVWGAAWGDPQDFTEFRGFAGGERIATARIPGF